MASNLVVFKDGRIVVNRVLKDTLLGIFVILLLFLYAFLSSGSLDNTKYAIFTIVGLIFIRAILKMIEKHKASEQFHWFWTNIVPIFKTLFEQIISFFHKKEAVQPSQPIP
jgi:uncharacterized membrane protein HdeD (DUF308 family)